MLKWWIKLGLLNTIILLHIFFPDGPLPDPTLIRANVPNQMMNRMQAQTGKYLKKIHYCDFQGVLELGSSCLSVIAFVSPAFSPFDKKISIYFVFLL